jgi:hypothetical protein
MKAIRNVLLGAAGLVVASLPANATSSTAVGDTPALNSTKSMQLAQRSENPGGAGFRNENPGGPGFKKKAKKKKVKH